MMNRQLGIKFLPCMWLAVLMLSVYAFSLMISLWKRADVTGYVLVYQKSNESQENVLSNTTAVGMAVTTTQELQTPPPTRPVPRIGKGGDVPWINKTDIHDYQYVIKPKRGKCTIESSTTSPRNLTLLILIKSSPNNAKLRDAARRTYIEGAMTYNTSAEMVFLLGMPKEIERQKDIMAEAEAHGDILQEDFVDSYYNLSTKLIMGFKWASKFCSNSDFVMSLDDDTTVDVVTLTGDLAEISSQRKLVLARPMSKTYPRRNKLDKWYVPSEVYQDTFYPPYPEGHAYVVSKDVAKDLYLTSLETPLFPFDDVYAGILLKKLNISLISRYRFYSDRRQVVQIKDYPRGDYFDWNLSVEKMETVWSAIEMYLKQKN